MDRPRLILPDGTEYELSGSLTTIGRTPDNDVSLPDDSNVSRTHAEIEERSEGEFWIFDLQSSNGTRLNGTQVTTEMELFDGDRILLGGSSEIEFAIGEREPDEEDDEDAAEPQPDVVDEAPEPEVPAVPPPEQPSKTSYLLIFASLLIGLAVILVVGAILYYFMGDVGGSSCDAVAEIVAPENGDIFSEPSAVEIEVSDPSCVSGASLMIGGKEFARLQSEPFEAELDPSKYPEMSDGLDRKITVTLFDVDGNPIPQNTEIAISIETIETETPTPTPVPDGGSDGTVPPQATPTPVLASLIDTQKMVTGVLPKIVSGGQYNVGNPRFLEAVSKMTAEYVSEGYYARASQYRDVINYQFIREQNLDPSLGYVLAMSRTKFQPTNRSNGAGLWNMDNQLVLNNAYNGICGAETIASQTQKCAAIASSSYLKDLILNVFNGDVVYGVAAFGMDKQEAAAWNASLPTDPRQRAEFWNVIRDPGRREQVVRYFAAAMVVENPQKFGLTNDKPISTLYPAYNE